MSRYLIWEFNQMCAKQDLGVAWNKCLQRHMVFVEGIGMKEGLEKEVKIFLKKEAWKKQIKILW